MTRGWHRGELPRSLESPRRDDASKVVSGESCFPSKGTLPSAVPTEKAVPGEQQDIIVEAEAGQGRLVEFTLTCG